jgi:hypothetical protein
MARRLYGASPADFTFDGDKSVKNVSLAVGRQNSDGTFSRITTGLQTLAGVNVATIVSDTDGEVRFYGTDLPSDLWVTTIDSVGNLGAKWYVMHSADIGSRLDLTIDQASLNAAVAAAFKAAGYDSIPARLSVLEASGGQVIPGAPQNVDVALSGRTATLTWNPPATNPTAVTSYEATMAPTEGSVGAPVTYTIPASSDRTAIFQNLVQGYDYSFTVLAVSGTARGPAGVDSLYVPPATQPAGPAPTTTVSLTASANRLDATWTLPTGAVSSTASRNGTDTGGGGAYTTPPIPVPDNTQDFTYLDPAQTYLITVRILMSDGSTVVGTATGKPTSIPVLDSGSGSTTPTTSPTAGVLTTSDNTVRRAQEFADSCGVGLQLTRPEYADLAKVKTSLDYMGINHVRAGFGTGRQSIINFFATQMPYARFWMVVDDTDWPSGYTPAQQVAEFSGKGTASTSFLPMLEGIEGPNETDLESTSAISAAATYLKARITPFRAAGVKVSSPALADLNSDAKHQTLGAMDVDFFTTHDYPGVDRMMNDTIARTKSRVGKYIMPGRANIPVISSEHGWASSPNGDQGKSMPPTGPFSHQHLRVYLECFKGLPGTTWNYRTYKYQLRDYDGTNVEASFGFFDSNWNAKPAATAVRNMLAIVKDSNPSSLSFTPAAPPNYTVTGGNTATRTLLMQKASGAWYVAVWQQVVTWNGSTTLVPAGVNVTVSWGGSADVKIYKPTASAVATSTSTGSSITVNSTFDPQIIEIGGSNVVLQSAPASTGGTTAPPVTAGYTPAAAPSLVSWWSINAATTDGADLATYPAGTGGTTAMTPGSSSRAVYRASGFAPGKPGAEFTPDSSQLGGPTYLDSTPLSGTSTATIAGTFLIPSSGTLPTGQMTIAGRELVYKLSIEGDLRPKLLLSSNGTSWAVNATTADALTRGVPYVYVITVGLGVAVLRINGRQVLSVPFSGALASTSTQYAVGGTNAAGAYPLRGVTGDMAISSAVLSGTNLSDLEAYLANTAGATLA